MLRESLRRSAERLAMFREDEEEVERLRERETAVVTENEMLREDNERLREALEKIAGLESVGRASDGLPMIFMRDEEMREIARAARSPDQVPEGEGVMGVTLRDAP
jgi:regulator of replication initiation timing